jgi:hypothetical protein
VTAVAHEPPPVADMFAELSDRDLDALISDLQRIRDTRRATAQQTQLGEHETAEEED